jgi:hypothetical protein
MTTSGTALRPRSRPVVESNSPVGRRRIRASHRQTLRRIGVAALVAIAVAYALALSRGEDAYAKSLSAAILALVTLPLFFYARRRAAYVDGRFPLLAAMGAVYGIYYGLPLLLGDYLTVRLQILPQNAAHAALEGALLGWSALLAGYFGAGRLGTGLKLGFEAPLHSARRVAVGLVLVGAGVGLGRALLTVPSTLAQPVRLLSLLGLFGLGILVAMALRGQMRPSGRLLLLCCVIPAYLLVQIPGGLVSALIYPALFFLAITWGVRGKVPWVPLAALAALAILLHPAMNEYRALTWYGPYAQASITDKGLLLSRIVLRNLTEGGTEYGNAALDTMGSRTNQLATVAWVMDLTPRPVPYWNGETYLSVFAALVPRAVWPDKPEQDLGQQFGHRYGLLDPQDTSTSYNFPMLAESYANFGWPGIILVMGLVGAIYRVIENAVTMRRDDYGGLVVGAFVLMQLVNMESDFSLVFGGVAQSLLFVYVIGKIMSGRSTARVSLAQVGPR